MSDIGAIVDSYFELQAEIFEHVGYVEDWRVIPLDDCREMYWAVDRDEREWLKFSPSLEALEYWLGNHADEYGEFGSMLYEDEIYTQRFLPKWVYRGEHLTMVCVDTHTDGNKLLRVLSNEREVRRA